MKTVVVSLFCVWLSVVTIVAMEVGEKKIIIKQEQKIQVNQEQQLLNSLTVREKIGQLFCVAAASCHEQKEESLATGFFNSPYNMDHEHVKQLVRDYNVGSILYLFKSMPQEQMVYTRELQALSKIPLLIVQDCEWGLSMRLYNTVRYPRNLTLGAIQDLKLLYEFGKEIGAQCKAIGVDMNLAPVADVNNNAKNPVINDRSFGENSANVKQATVEVMRGMHDAGILTCAKHFPGHGDTAVDSHLGLPLIEHSLERLEAVELEPFKELIAHDIPGIMLAHVSIPALGTRKKQPSSLTYSVVTELLKNKLGFKGLVITDGLGMRAITKYYSPGDIELQAVLAGNDIILGPLDVPKAIDQIEQAVLDGRLSQDDLDQRVLKILAAKSKLRDNQSNLTIPEALEFINRPEAKALKKRLFAAAITCVKNNGMLPLAVHDWLNTAVVAINKSGSQFLQSLSRGAGALYEVNGQENLDDLYSAIVDMEIIIVGIFDMNKFSEQQWGISDTTLKFLARLKQDGKKVILAIFGNPYSLQLFTTQDCILVAYEDDPDAQHAAAEVLLSNLKPNGKLPISSGIYQEGFGLTF